MCTDAEQDNGWGQAEPDDAATEVTVPGLVGLGGAEEGGNGGGEGDKGVWGESGWDAAVVKVTGASPCKWKSG
ncbi:hypothetical protein CGRA01v4_13693 [Colletotrichum graminicola]|nr:hypothetical protein CGRA01v4_13693 [Colletotrichum graminicola]